jgi:glyoxylase-like metal-dependent hydrolase (beta-lactamase superfamily II)
MALKIAERWFERRRIDDDITLLWEPHVVPLLRCNIWHVRGRERDLLIDTGMGIVSLKAAAEDLLQKPVTAVATHVHLDHIGGHHEFEDCVIHRSEAIGLTELASDYTLVDEDFDPEDLSPFSTPAYPVEGPMLTAIPHAGYDLAAWRLLSARKTRPVEEGDVLDLGDRSFEVLHLPGHSRGSIGLWEKSTGIFFSGDAIYDGALLDELPGSDVAAYVRTMRRLRDLPVSVVHGGHCPSFGRDRLVELANAYLAQRNAA